MDWNAIIMGFVFGFAVGSLVMHRCIEPYLPWGKIMTITEREPIKHEILCPHCGKSPDQDGKIAVFSDRIEPLGVVFMCSKCHMRFSPRIIA